MLKEGGTIRFSARILACDTDGNVYLFLGDDDWSVSPYQWGGASNQIWFDTINEVIEAASFAELPNRASYKNYKIVPDSAEIIRYTTSTLIEPLSKFELTAPK
jgi:hypothetical protein